MQQSNLWSIAFEACTKEKLKEVCWSNGPHWILHAQTGTRLEHKLTKLNTILFNQQGTIKQSILISTTLNPMQSVWNLLIPLWQTLIILFLWQSMWKVVCAVQIQRRVCRKLRMNSLRPLYILAEATTGLIYIKIILRVNSQGKYVDGFYTSTIDDKDGHIPSPLIMFTCTALYHAVLEWQ